MCYRFCGWLHSSTLPWMFYITLSQESGWLYYFLPLTLHWICLQAALNVSHSTKSPTLDCITPFSIINNLTVILKKNLHFEKPQLRNFVGTGAALNHAFWWNFPKNNTNTTYRLIRHSEFHGWVKALYSNLKFHVKEQLTNLSNMGPKGFHSIRGVVYLPSFFNNYSKHHSAWFELYVFSI